MLRILFIAAVLATALSACSIYRSTDRDSFDANALAGAPKGQSSSQSLSQSPAKTHTPSSKNLPLPTPLALTSGCHLLHAEAVTPSDDEEIEVGAKPDGTRHVLIARRVFKDHEQEKTEAVCEVTFALETDIEACIESSRHSLDQFIDRVINQATDRVMDRNGDDASSGG